jgi:hypothetical protein
VQPVHRTGGTGGRRQTRRNHHGRLLAIKRTFVVAPMMVLLRVAFRVEKPQLGALLAHPEVVEQHSFGAAALRVPDVAGVQMDIALRGQRRARACSVCVWSVCRSASVRPNGGPIRSSALAGHRLIFAERRR